MLNKVILVGSLARQIELKRAGNMSVVKTSLRIRNDYKNKETGKYESEFVNIEAWGSNAEYLNRFCQKGDLITVIGTFRTTSFEGQNGKVYQSFVRVDTIANETPHFDKPQEEPQLVGFTAKEAAAVDDFFAGTGVEVEKNVDISPDSFPFY